MDITKAIRNPTRVHNDLFKKGNELCTKSGCWIYFPAGYTTKDLAHISTTVTALATFVITTDHKTYGAASSTAMAQFMPTIVEDVEINGVPYYRMEFEAGSAVMRNVFLLREKPIVYNVMSYIYDYGNVPFWFNAKDHAELVSDTRYWNDFTVFKDQITADVYAAHLQRNPNKVSEFMRHTIKKVADLSVLPTFLALRAGPANKTSRLAKLADVNLNRGIRHALLEEPIRPEPLEQLYMR